MLLNHYLFSIKFSNKMYKNKILITILFRAISTVGNDTNIFNK